MSQSVIVHFPTPAGKFGSPDERQIIDRLEDALTRVLDEQKAGDFDGNLFGQWTCELYMYGPDANRLFEVIRPVLRAASITHGGYAVLRHGEAEDEGASVTRVDL